MTSKGNEEAQPEGGPAAFAAEEKQECLDSVGVGELRDYLLRLRSGMPVSDDDIRVGEHAVRCQVCRKRIEEMYYFEEALRGDFDHLAPLMKAEVVRTSESIPVSAGAATTESTVTRRLQDRVARKFTGAIAEVQNKITALDEEYARAFPLPRALREFQKSCSTRYEQLDPARKDWIRESMIDLLRNQKSGLQRPQWSLNEIIDENDRFEFLLGIAKTEIVASSTDQRIFYRDPESQDPDTIIIEADRLIPRAADVSA
jgi:hypothetical protein